MASIDTDIVSDALLELFSIMGIPEEIESDKSTQFTSVLLSVREIRTKPYHL